MSISSVDNLKECCIKNQTGVMRVLWSNQTSLTQTTASIVIAMHTSVKVGKKLKKGCTSFLKAQKLEPLVCWVARGFPKTMENSFEKGTDYTWWPQRNGIRFDTCWWGPHRPSKVEKRDFSCGIFYFLT